MNEQYKFSESRKSIDGLEFSDNELKTFNDLGLTSEDLQKLFNGPSFAEGSYALIFELPDDAQGLVAKAWKNPEQDSKRAEHEHVALRLLRMRNSEEVPRLKGFLKSATILFEEKIEGRPIENFDRNTIDQLAEAVAKIHSIELKTYGRPLTKRKRGTKMDFFNDELTRLRTALISLPEQPDIVSTVNLAIDKTENDARKKSEAFQDDDFTLIHFDLNKSNILQLTDNRIVIVDWEQAAAGDNAMDIAKLFLKLNFDEEQREEFLAKYEKKLPKKDEYFERRLETFEPLVLVNSILWRLRVLRGVPQEASSVNEEQFYYQVKASLDIEIEKLNNFLQE